MGSGSWVGDHSSQAGRRKKAPIRRKRGEQGVQAFVNLAVSPKAARKVIDRLSMLPELRQLAAVSGEFDYLAVLRAPSTQRLDALLDEIGAIDGVLRTTTSVLLAMRIDRVA
jgi:DNA-binding Lrp family transcriptional regulator